MAEPNITETEQIDRAPSPNPEVSAEPSSYEERGRALEQSVRRLPRAGAAPGEVVHIAIPAPAVPAPAIPAERIDAALAALAECIGAAVTSTHPRRFQSIRRIAKLAELLSREKSIRGVLDVAERPALGGVIGGYQDDLAMDEQQGVGLGPPIIGMGMNDGAQMARDMTQVLQEQTQSQRGKNRASELVDMQRIRDDLEADLKNKKRTGSVQARERLQSELDVIQQRIDTLLDEIKRELPQENPKDEVVHP